MRLLLSLALLLLAVRDVWAECEVVIRSGDTLSQISLDVGCGAYKSAKYNQMVTLNQKLGKFTSDNSISIGTAVVIPDVCLGNSLPSRCRAANDCMNGNAAGVCPGATSTCEETAVAFVCACKSTAVRSTADVCSTRIPGGAGNNHCTKSCMDDPCQPNPCSGGTCSRNGASFTCACPAGTQLSGNTCVNLCASVNCGVAGSSCSNGQCTCPAGYQPSADKKTCVDRCTVAGAVPCSGPMSMCSRGTCSCGGGNVLRAGGVCESSTECNSTSFVCVGGQCALDETNQRVCRCPPGMKLDAANHCVDIDECKDGTDECVGPATCVNQFGATYTCSCDDFNKKQGTFLVLKNQFECGQPCQKNCNGVGTCSDGTCTCQSGFVADANVGCRAQCPNDCSGQGTCSETGSCICNDPAAQSLDCSGGSGGNGGNGEGPEGPGDTNTPDNAGSDSVTDADGNIVASSSTDLLVIILSVVAGIILWIVLVLLFLAWRRRRENRSLALTNVAFTAGPDMGHYQQPPPSDRFHYGDTNRSSPYDSSMAQRDQSFPAPHSQGNLPARGYPGESQGYPGGDSKGYPSGPDAQSGAQYHSMQSFNGGFDTTTPEPAGIKPQAYHELDRSEFHRYQQ